MNGASVAASRALGVFMSALRRRRAWSVAVPLASLPLVAGAVLAVQSPAQAAFTPLVQFTATVSSPDTATVPPAAQKSTPIGLSFHVTNTSNFLVPLGRVAVTVPAGFTASAPTVSRAGWTASISGSTVRAVITKPLVTPGLRPGESVDVGVSAVHGLTVAVPTNVSWPVSATGPFGLVPFTLRGGAPVVVVLPVGVAAFAGVPGSALTGIAAPESDGTSCALQPTNPVCSKADLPKGANGNVYFSQRTCTTSEPSCTLGTEVELSGDFGTLYSPTSPGSVVLTCLAAKCPHRATGDSATENESFVNYDYNYTCASGCAEGGDPFGEREVNEDFANYPVYVQLKGAATFGLAPRCVPEADLTTTGKITDPTAIATGYCVDVNAITRAGNVFTGDLVRPVLFVEDPKMR